MKQLLIFIAVFFIIKTSVAQQRQGDPALTEVWNPVPRIVTPGQSASLPPSDAIILFSGNGDSSKWSGLNGKAFGWKLSDSFMTVTPGAGEIHTKQSFGDCQLHIEWRTPSVVKGESQGRGNSGIFLMG